MRPSFSLATIITLALAVPVVAEPIPVGGTKSAVWNNPTGGPSTGAGTDWLRFGEYDAASLGWSGNLNFSTSLGTPFSLGIVWLTNGSSLNPPTHATFSITLDLNTPTNEPPATFDFDANLLSTNPAGGGDLKFSVVPGQKSSWTSPTGTTYSLEMLGLSSNWEWDGNTTNEITALADCEDNQTYAWIYGRLNVEDPTITHAPEPSALVLAGLGLALLLLLRRFSRARHQPTSV
jgi:hypothetical protein